MSAASAIPLGTLRPAHGHVEHADFEANALQGYVFLPGHRPDSVQIYVDGILAGTGGLMHRPEVTERFRFAPLPRLDKTGYRIPLESGRLSHDIHRVTIVGCTGDKPVAQMRSIVFPPSVVPEIPIPPPGLIELTQGDHDERAYKHLGFRYFHQLLDVISRHRELSAMQRMFDWGCGSGRIAAFFLTLPQGPQVFGGDYDHWAADWCRINLPAGDFRALHPLPPLPFPDAHFDLIIAIGVVGGCGKAEWAVWLPELRRVLSPRGLLLITIQGVFAATVLYPSEALRQLRDEGLFDGTAFDAAYPPSREDSRYRGGTYMTREYVADSWSPHFRILEHLEGEINSDLDLIAAEPRH